MPIVCLSQLSFGKEVTGCSIPNPSTMNKVNQMKNFSIQSKLG